jgi:hypothetical protein
MRLRLIFFGIFVTRIALSPGDCKPMFFDAITGALNEIKKVLFGNNQG